MKLVKKSQAGSFESSDILVLIEPTEQQQGRVVELQSSVMLQYGDSIRKIIAEMLDKYEIQDVHLIANDKGALEATIYARLETAILRAADAQQGTL